MIEDLKAQLLECDSLPFLFVGSGFSKRYLNLPNWEELLREIAELINNNPYFFSQQERYIESTIDKKSQYNLFMTSLCDRLSSYLLEIWYDDKKFEESREKYKDIIENEGFLPIKAEIASIIDKKRDVVEQYIDEFNILKQITTHSIAGIITTNYDTLIETIFNYNTYNTQDELLFNTSYEIGEIYKIHGSVTDPNSIMITTKDYEQIEQKHKYVAAKLLTIFVEHPIIFIGYSLNDEDIKLILESISQCLTNSQKLELSKRLIFIEWNATTHNIYPTTHTISFHDNSTLSMTKYTLKSFVELYSTIQNHKNQIPVKTLRKLKHSMYELALTNETPTKIMVMSPDQIVESDEYEIMVGFGITDLAKRGYTSITANEIFEDLILNNQNFINEYLVKQTLPKLIKSVNGSLPFYKYLSKRDEFPEQLRQYKKNSINDFLPKSMKTSDPIEQKNIQEIKDSFPDYKHQFTKIPLLKERINLEELEAYLKDVFSQHPRIFSYNAPIPTDMKRLIKIYDFLKYS